MEKTKNNIMKLDKELKVRLSDAQLEKAKSDSEALDKTVSKHIRDMIVDFEVVQPQDFDCFRYFIVKTDKNPCKEQCKECKKEQNK